MPAQVNMGRFQAPVYIAGRTLCQFAEKAYLWNAAAFTLGFRGMDRQSIGAQGSAAASSSSGPADSAGDESADKKTLKQQAAQTWQESTSNQLDRAALMYSSQEHYFLQRIIVRSLSACAELHTKWLGLRAARRSSPRSVLRTLTGKISA